MMKARHIRLLLSGMGFTVCLGSQLAWLAGAPVLGLPSVTGTTPSSMPSSTDSPTASHTATPSSTNAPSTNAPSTNAPSTNAPSTSPATAPSGAPYSPNSSGTTSGALQGSVVTREQTAESVLIEIEESVKHLKDASWGAFTEAQRPDVVFIGGPNVVGGAVIPAIGGNGFIGTGGYLPVRKKWIDFFAMHVQYLGPILKQELDSFQLPTGVSSDTVNEYAEYHKLAERLPDLCNKMLIACQGPKYDNMTIAVAAGMLNEELKRYDKQRRIIYKDIKEDFKRSADDQERKEKEELKEKEKKEKEEQKLQDKNVGN
jgi:hypothetical protein